MKHNLDSTKRIPLWKTVLRATLLGSIALTILSLGSVRADEAPASAPAPAPAATTEPMAMEPTSQPANATVTQLVAPTRWWVTGVTAHGQTWSGLSFDTSPKSVIAVVSHAHIPAFFSSVVFEKEIVDAKDQQAAISFAAMLHGHVIKGAFIATAYPPLGVQVSVILADADAPAEEFTALANAIPAMAKLQPVDLPGGRVTGLPEGWKLDLIDPASSRLVASGPHGEAVRWGDMVSLITPEFAKTTSGKEWNGRLVESEPLAPVEALQFLYKAAAARSDKKTAPMVDKVIWSTTAPANGNIQTSLIEYTVTISPPQAATEHRRVVGYTTVVPPYGSIGVWYVGVNSVSAPDEQFAQAYPTMSLISACYVEDMIHDAKLKKGWEGDDHVDRMEPPTPPLIGSDKQTFLDREAARELISADAKLIAQTAIVHLAAAAVPSDSAIAITLHDTETGSTVSASLCNADVIVDALNHATSGNRFTSQKLDDQK